MTKQKIPAVIMEEVTDPEELVKAHIQDERFDRNWTWLQTHASEVYTRHRGKCICVAGEELFVADTPEEVLSLFDGRACHYPCILLSHWSSIERHEDSGSGMG